MQEQRNQAAPEIASAGTRIVAFVVDVLVAALLFTILTIVFGIERSDEQAFFFVGLFVSIAYVLGFTLVRAATPGKMILGTYIGDPDGRPLAPDAAILRYLVYFVGGTVVVGHIISFVMLLSDRRHRTLHDRIAKTLVYRGRPDLTNDRWR